MEGELHKADILRERLQASYEECQEALQASDGDLLGALAWIEHQRRERGNSLNAVVSQAVSKAQEVGQGGTVDRLCIRLGDHVLGEFPVLLAGTAAAAVAVLAVLLQQLSVEIHISSHPEPAGKEEGHPVECS
jgi:hypothetical protein